MIPNHLRFLTPAAEFGRLWYSSRSTFVYTEPIFYCEVKVTKMAAKRDLEFWKTEMCFRRFWFFHSLISFHWFWFIKPNIFAKNGCYSWGWEKIWQILHINMWFWAFSAHHLWPLTDMFSLILLFKPNIFASRTSGLSEWKVYQSDCQSSVVEKNIPSETHRFYTELCCGWFWATLVFWMNRFSLILILLIKFNIFVSGTRGLSQRKVYQKLWFRKVHMARPPTT